MKKVVFNSAFCILILCPLTGYGETGNAGKSPTGEETIIENSGGTMSEGNYQDKILSDPATNSGARVGVQGGGNTAIIRQSGSQNSSSITQSGNNNYAEQSQNGNHNEIYLKQKGKNNRHTENQTGDHNRKVIIQNGTETVDEQSLP